VQGKWLANAPMVFVDQYVPVMKEYTAIMLEVGDQDPIAVTEMVQQFDQTLTRLGIDHGFEVYEGDHGNRVTGRFAEKVLPFFSEHLQRQDR
jgi:predicted esterase